MTNTIAEKLNNNTTTLEEKLALIDQLMNSKEAQEQFNRDNGRSLDTPVDPMDALMCEGCQ